MAAKRLAAQLGAVLLGLGIAGPAFAYTANKVWFEALPTGIYRVHAEYTVPEFKEFRQSFVEFGKKADAEAYYWDLIRGADFFPSDPASRRFINPVSEPEPW